MAMMIKSSSAMLLMLIVVTAMTETARSQTCSSELSNLSVCAPFVVSGGGQNIMPSAECCTSLQQVDRGCLCNTLRITAQIPAACNLPPVTCGS
ncbi:hypothetical protein GIB67_040729 [Kingdonia uniflora]|uniref:Bifunctional inhibitor/plant lipid transfer protein/seed storage helical domain-containing protein n=1 Tax=Kingdonia uniflora TaxID=39325 RepID=A0A7J7KUD2_9MAGN|nr:hypothetical protein GIB67_040729 [Kingdonia uniflora]